MYEQIKEFSPKDFFEAIPDYEKNCNQFWKDMEFLIKINDNSYCNNVSFELLKPEIEIRNYMKKYLLSCKLIKEKKRIDGDKDSSLMLIHINSYVQIVTR